MVRIGDVELGVEPLFLAPMEDVTDPSFRYVCKQFGADVLYTEFISSDGLIRDAAKSLKKLEIYDYERPIGIQLYGHLIEPMVQSAIITEQAKPDIIDINFGCPVSKISRRGAGAGMLKNIPLMIEMTAKIVKAVDTPVTVKTRLGWDEESKHIVEIAERLQDIGIKAITIHGRTRAQLYKGEADWALIGDVKNNPRMKIPVIGNGDIVRPPKAREYFNRYGVDGIMIGRGAIGRPWVFRDIKHYLKTGEIPEPLSIKEKVDLARMHFTKSVEFKGDRVGVLEMRRHFSNYFKGLYDFKATRLRLVTCNDIEEIYSILDQVEDKWGNTEPVNEISPDN